MARAASGERPRLRAGSQIIPLTTGWMTRSGSKVELMMVEGLPSGGDALLDLFDGSRDIDALSRDSGIAPATMARLVDELGRHGMLEEESGGPGEIVDRRDWLVGGTNTHSPPSGTLRVLLGGLGALGLSVLRDLRRLGHVHGYLYDPAPVGWNDVGRFYRHADIGRPKSEIIAASLPDEHPPAFRHLELGVSTPASQQEALLPALREVEVAVWCMDQPTAVVQSVAVACRRTNVPFVLVDVDVDTVTLGISPATEPDAAAGCAVCALHHRAARDPFRAALLPHLERRFPQPARWHHALEPPALGLVSKLVVLAICKALDVSHDRRPGDHRLLSVDLEARTARMAPVTKHQACRSCFVVPAASSRALRRDAERQWAERYRGGSGTALDTGMLWSRLRALAGEDHVLFQSPRPVSSRERQSVWRFVRDRGVVPEPDIVANAHRVV